MNMTTTVQNPTQRRKTSVILPVLAVMLVLATIVFAALWIARGQELSNTKQDLDTARSQLTTVQQELAAARAQINALSSRISELTAGPRPEIAQRTANSQSTGFLGSGVPKLVVAARIVNRGAAGMVRLTATANWTNGSRTGFTDAYFAQGEEKPMTVELTDVPNTATYTATASAR